jgi:PCFT/HCP family folate transporter-like MFS transporter 1/3
VASLQAKNTVIQAVPPVIFTLLAGPWSDRHGRKPLIIIAMFGYVISNLVFLVNLYFFYELKAEFLLFESLQDLTGGRPIFCLASYAYITDVSDPKTRTKRLSYLDGVFPFGFYIGNSLSSIIKKELGFSYNFGFGILCALLSVLYCAFFVKESKTIRQEKIEKRMSEQTQDHCDEGKELEEANEMVKTKGRIFCEMFQLESFKQGFATVLKKRGHYKRSLLLILILGFVLEIFFFGGLWSSHFLFLRKQLNWTSMQYTRYTSILGLIGLLSQYIAVPLLANKAKIHDSTISLLETFTSIINLFILAFAVNEWMLYIGGLVAFLDAAATTMFRSLISKTVEPDEIGKVFSVVGVFHALLPFATGPIFGVLYMKTVEFTPNAFIFLLIGIKVLIFGNMLLVKLLLKREDQQSLRETNLCLETKEYL